MSGRGLLDPTTYVLTTSSQSVKLCYELLILVFYVTDGIRYLLTYTLNFKPNTTINFQTYFDWALRGDVGGVALVFLIIRAFGRRRCGVPS